MSFVPASLIFVLLSITTPGIRPVASCGDGAHFGQQSVRQGAEKRAISAVRARLLELMRSGVETKRPNSAWPRLVLKRATVFDGSYDWHSCIVAHWALLVTARTEGDRDLEQFLLARLNQEALQAEVALLQELEAPLITFPYDQAWFLMLLSELDKRAVPRSAEPASIELDALRSMRREVEARILLALETQPFPEDFPPRDRGGKTYNGFYRSLLMTYLLLRWSDPITPGITERLDVLWAERFAPHRREIEAFHDGHAFDFLHLPAILALCEDVTPIPNRIDVEWSPSGPNLPSTVTLRDVHRLGVEITRSWQLALLAQKGNAPAAGAYQEWMQAYLERRDLWDGDFTVVSHWIPQYLWIAEWIRAGRP